MIDNPTDYLHGPDDLSDRWQMVGLGRFELPTSRLSGVRSNQLSYRPVIFASKNLPTGSAFIKKRERSQASCTKGTILYHFIFLRKGYVDGDKTIYKQL